MDELDRQIIRELQADGRSSSLTISRNVGCSNSTVSRRIKDLIKTQAITIKAIPDIKITNSRANAIIMLNADSGKIDSICKQLSTIPEVHFLASVFGRFDIVITVFFESKEQLIDFIKNKLSHITGVKEIETLYIAEQKKFTFNIF